MVSISINVGGGSSGGGSTKGSPETDSQRRARFLKETIKRQQENRAKKLAEGIARTERAKSAREAFESTRQSTAFGPSLQEQFGREEFRRQIAIQRGFNVGPEQIQQPTQFRSGQQASTPTPFSPEERGGPVLRPSERTIQDLGDPVLRRKERPVQEFGKPTFKSEEQRPDNGGRFSLIKSLLSPPTVEKLGTQLIISKQDEIQDFLFTKPDITSQEFQDKGVFGKGVEFVKFGAFQPVAGLGQELKKSGAKLKTTGRPSEFVGGTIIGGVGTLIPETPAGQITLFGGVKALTSAPPIIRTGANIFFGTTGTLGAFDRDLTTEERIGSGIVGGLGAFGTAVETVPFIRGFGSRFTGRSKPKVTEIIETPTGKSFEAEFITDLKFADSTKPSKIGIIPEGPGLSGISRGDFPQGSGALGRGGFGFKPSEQLQAFTGERLRLTTSQADIPIVDGVIKTDPSISPLGFFFTPADPITGIPQTRISRLGLVDFFKRPTADAEIGFLPSSSPKIIVTTPTELVGTGKTGFGGRARVSPKGSTELEVTAQRNIEIIKDLGTTSIKGQKVNLFEGKLTDQPISGFGKFGNIGKVVTGSSKIKTTIPVSSLLTPSFGISFSVSPSSTKLSDSFSLGSSKISDPFSPVSVGKGKKTRGIPSLKIPSIGGIPSFTSRRGGSSGIDFITRTTLTGIPTSPTPDIFDDPLQPRGGRRRRKSDDRKKEKKKSKRKTKGPRFVKPSFTASILELEGKFPKASGIAGILPSQIRVAPIGTFRKPPKKRKSKKK